MRYSNYFFAGAVLVSMTAGASRDVLAADAARGKTLFYKYGCEQCHGNEGQGGYAGKRIAPEPPNLLEFMQYVRDPSGVMPGYSKKLLPADQDLADIHAYLSARPKPASPDVLKKLGLMDK